MDAEEQFKVEFHQEAVARFNELAQVILNNVSSPGPVPPPDNRPSNLHPVINISEADIIGEVKLQRSVVNLLGEEAGRYWESNGLLVGWEGEKFEEIRNLARKFESATPIKGYVSHSFLVDEIFEWLRQTLELQRKDTLIDYIAVRCSAEIKNHEIWIPVYRTYSAHDFTIGNFEFRTPSRDMLEKWYARLFRLGETQDQQAAIAINRERSDIQGSIAVRIKVKAETTKAREIAQAAANEATGLLRFLSPVNWKCRFISYCLPVGQENTTQTIELFVEDGVIKGSSRESVEHGPAAWSIDKAREMSPGLFEALHRLASSREATEFRRELYGALQLYSRQSIAGEPSHKIVFVVAAIESLLLKDSSEPIQKNLGERMAFLIGISVEGRRKIIGNVDAFYRIRSALIHHGHDVSSEDMAVIDEFFFNVWLTLTHLLTDVDQYKTKQELLGVLEDRKLS
jgi:hypothetical protein